MSIVSVIVPVYNTSNYLDKCLTSLINQTMKEIEIIVINDGSTDNSKEIIEKYLNDKRVSCYERTNHGIGDTRNYGIEKSSGKYICFVDSDDYVDTEYLKKMYLKATESDLDIVICDYYEVSNKKNKKYELLKFNTTNLKETPNLLIDINLGPCNKLFKRNLFLDRKNRFPTSIKYEDIALISILINKAKKIGKLDEALCYYNIHSSSETRTMDKKVFDIFKSMDIILCTFKDSNRELLDYVNYLVISKINLYMIQQRKQKNKKLRNKFIDAGFDYLKNNITNYNDNMYYKKRNRLKLIVEKNKNIMKLYCGIYNLIN